jgi:hypothetical protein
MLEPFNFLRRVTMSMISSNNPISKYDPKQVPTVHDGEVLILSRGNKQSKTESMYAVGLVIPEQDIRDNLDSLMPHIQAMIHAARVGIVRANVERGHVLDEELNLTACITAMDSEGRLTKEAISQYLKREENIEMLRAAFAEKLGYRNDPLTSEQSAKLDKLAAKLSDTFLELAGSRTYWEEPKRKSATSYLELFEDSPMKSRLLGKIAVMSEKSNDDDLMEVLGF